MKLFRAVSKTGFQAGTVYRRQATPRAPSNVPYVVDNLWEALRPAHLPSRRHAIYASPTPELALANASSAGVSRDEYQVCALVLTGEAKIAHLGVTDARYHSDVRVLQQAVMAVLGRDFGAQSFAVRAAVAPLFMPYLSAAELQELARNPLVAQCLAKAAEVSTFWTSTASQPQPSSDGELFFELSADASYLLQPI